MFLDIKEQRCLLIYDRFDYSVHSLRLRFKIVEVLASRKTLHPFLLYTRDLDTTIVTNKIEFSEAKRLRKGEVHIIVLLNMIVVLSYKV